MELANGSLLELLTNGKRPILLGRIVSIATGSGDKSEEVGTIDFRVERELTKSRWHGPASINLNFSRYANPLHRAMQAEGWNAIDLEPNKLLVIVVDDWADARKGTSSNSITAKSVSAVSGEDDPLIEGVSEALRTEAAAPDERKSLIAKGIQSDFAFWNEYCHYACGRLHRIGRSDAIELEIGVLENENDRLANRYSSVVNLELELFILGNSQDELNRRILSAWIRTLDSADLELRRMILQSLDRVLYGNAPPDSTNYRQEIMKGIVIPLRSLQSLRHCIASGPASQEAARIVQDFGSPN